jgi:hypothetical protein
MTLELFIHSVCPPAEKFPFFTGGSPPQPLRKFCHLILRMVEQCARAGENALRMSQRVTIPRGVQEKHERRGLFPWRFAWLRSQTPQKDHFYAARVARLRLRA